MRRFVPQLKCTPWHGGSGEKVGQPENADHPLSEHKNNNEPLRIEIDLMTCDVNREKCREKPTLRRGTFFSLILRRLLITLADVFCSSAAQNASFSMRLDLYDRIKILVSMFEGILYFHFLVFLQS